VLAPLVNSMTDHTCGICSRQRSQCSWHWLQYTIYNIWMTWWHSSANWY